MSETSPPAGAHEGSETPGNASGNAQRFVWSNALQNVGDNITAAKSVLPWILAAAGTPALFSALLVPIRESGSMLPQAPLAPWVMSKPYRRNIWVVGSLIQAASAAGIAAATLLLRGSALGFAVVVLLATLSLGRAACSITGKDMQARIKKKGSRGKLQGVATSLGGVVSIAVGVCLVFVGEHAPPWILALLIFCSALAWVLAAWVFSGIEEPVPPQETKQETNASFQARGEWLRECFRMVREDAKFRRFVIVRSLLLVTALSSAFLVTLAAEYAEGSAEFGTSFGSVGAFLALQGAAGFLAGRVSGALADRSAKAVMAAGSLAASLVLLVVASAALLAPQHLLPWLIPTAYFLILLIHAGIRVARKTYVVDMATGDQRTKYVANANTLMGLVLLGTGAITAVLSLAGSVVAIVFLALLGIAGAVAARGMVDVSEKRSYAGKVASAGREDVAHSGERDQ